MQNKGAIRLFAILLALACAYYLMFTYVGVGIENQAKQYAEEYITHPEIVEGAKKASAIEKEQTTYLDSVKNSRKTYYLDSLKKLSVIDLGPLKYTYEEVRNQQLNLGLDLKGGMNVTLEVAVSEIIRGLSNNSNDPAFVKALENATAAQKTSAKDYVTLFGEQYKILNPTGRLAINFQTIELKGKIDFNTSDEDVLKFLRERMNDAIETSEKTLRTRIDKFGVTQPNIQRLAASGRILIELPGVTDKKRVRKLLQGTANLEFWIAYDNAEEKDGIASGLAKANTRLKEILNPAIAKDTTLAKSDTSSLAKTKTEISDTTKKAGSTSLSEQLGVAKTDSTGAKLATRNDTIEKMKKDNPLFSMLNPSYKYNEKQEFQGLAQGPIIGYALITDTAKIGEYLRNPKIKTLFPPYTRFFWTFKTADADEKVLQLLAMNGTITRGVAPLSGDIITDARVVFDPTGGDPNISMTMNTDAANIWRKLTRDNVGKCVAIVLDNSVYSYPVINGEISGGSTSIEGHFSLTEATDLVTILKAGKLPAPARIVAEETVGPILGAEAISKGFKSTIIALLLVLVFMGLYYSKAGWVADFAMVINNFFVIGILASFGAVLTLPGIAGIVLTIAMSVDANILIFERVREELNLGKTTAVAIKEGYKNAMSSVIDSHITGLLLGIILYVFGTGPIQGFATTLIIGIVSSLFCAIFITRLVFDRWLGKGKEISFGNKYTAHAFKKININFVGKRKYYYIFSALIIIAGIFSYVKKGGFSLGVDFKGGRSYVVRFDNVKTTDEVRDALAVSFGAAPEVKTYGEGGSQVRITTTYLIEDASENAETMVEDKLNEGLTKLGEKYQVMSSQKVGETVSRDIKTKAIWAVLLSCLVMFIFIFIRFKKWQYGFGAVVALFHDVAIVLSVYTIFDGILPFSLEITQDFIAAILTVMSYSMVDSVVVFDRIREYLTERNKADLDKNERVKVINYALNSTLSRTINTALTIFFVMLAIFIFGGETIKGFAFALLIGIAIGTYSSICIATPIVIDLEKEKGDVEKK